MPDNLDARQAAPDLLICDVEIEGRVCDLRVSGGRIAEIGETLSGDDALDGRGGALIPGLIDHHIHLMAAAAARTSVTLDAVRGADALAATLRAAPGQGWLRATGYHEHSCGELNRAVLDRILPDRPARVQHQTGSVWVLNSAALRRLDFANAPPGVDAASGRISRSDVWLRTQLPETLPDLSIVGTPLVAAGVTGVTDASVSNDAGAVARLAEAQASGALAQRIMAMSGGPLEVRGEDLFAGPVKIILDDNDLTPLEEVTSRVRAARRQARRVAIHCVTAAELALALAAFEDTGAVPGDRIEHGGIIAEAAIPAIADLGLTVVTQSGFVAERGDRYLAEVDPNEHDDLYRCASLKRRGVPVAGSSDAPYSSLDPWAAMRAAVTRQTLGGAQVGSREAVTAREALDLYLGGFERPGGPARRVQVGARADLCLLKAPLADVLAELSRDLVAATVRAGRIVHQS